MLLAAARDASSLTPALAVGLFVGIPAAVIVIIIGVVLTRPRLPEEPRSGRSGGHLRLRNQPVLGRPADTAPGEGPRPMIADPARPRRRALPAAHPGDPGTPGGTDASPYEQEQARAGGETGSETGAEDQR